MNALDYAKLGLAVFPCHYPIINGTSRCSCGVTTCRDLAKHPYGRHAPNGFKNATTDANRINRWAGGAPYNIAIATGAVSNIVVIDIDPRNGGSDSLAQLEQEHGTLPATWRAFTGGGGNHVYFRHPGGRIACSEGKMASGIDVKGDGGYVIAPPSRHISGRYYAWDVDHHPEDIPLAAMPGWLLKRAAQPNGDKAKIDWKAFASSPIVEGGRNGSLSRHAALRSLAGLLFYRLSREPHLAAQLLIAFNEVHCDPPLPDAELIRIIDHAAAREITKRRPA